MFKKKITKILCLILVLCFITPTVALAAPGDPQTVQYIYFQDPSAEMVAVDYIQAINDAILGNLTLYNGIKTNLGPAILNGAPIYLETTIGTVLDYQMAITDNKPDLLQFQDDPTYQTVRPVSTKKLTVVGGVAIIVPIVAPAAPAVTNNDTANTVSGMMVGYEYSLDGALYVLYDAATFAAIDFSGNHSLLVRVAAAGLNPAGAVKTLTFTTNVVTPPVTNNDVLDTVSGMMTTMEYSYDGASYVLYDPFDIAFASLDLHGDHILLVRYAASGGNPASEPTTLIFTTRPGPLVTNDDTTNTVSGMDTTMEYSLDGLNYTPYDAIVFGALDLSGDKTLLVRYSADFFLGYPPSLDTVLTFTMNPGPNVTNDDIANTVSGMIAGYEYNLDTAGYVAYNAITFDAIDFSGNHILLVRVASDGINPPGPAATLIFTTNPVAPDPPAVTNNDVTNTVSGMTSTMEYSYDGAPYVAYDPFDIAFASLDFHGDHTLLVRYAAVGGTPASLATTLTFTSNPITVPGPLVTNDDVANTVSGMDNTMEYSYDGAAYVPYDNFMGPDLVFNALDFTGDHILLVRYYADPITGQQQSLDTTLTFTTNPVTLSSIAITTPATKTTYAVGDVLSITGLVITGTYSDSSTAVVPITAGNITGFNSTTPVVGQTLTISVGGMTTTFNVNILKVTLNKTTTSMLLGMSDTLTATVLPLDAPNKNVIWTVASGSNSATVNNGLVTGINLGIATVTVTTVDGSIKAQCFVTVTNESNILTNFNLGRSMTYMPGFIIQFGDAIGLNLTAYNRMTPAQQEQVQWIMINAPTYDSLADIKNVFDAAVESIPLDAIHFATVETMNVALNNSAAQLGLDLLAYNALTPSEQEIINGKLLIPVYFGVYYTSAAEVQAVLDLAVSNASEAVTALAEINDATVGALGDALVNNAVLLGISLDSYILYSDQLTINTALDAQVFTNPYDLQTAIETILFNLTSLFLEPFNMATMDTIASIITDNAAALGLDLSIYDLLSPAEQEIVHGYLVSKPYFVSGYYSLAALHADFNEAVNNAPAAEIALAEINAATAVTIDTALASNAVLLGILLDGYDPLTMNAILAAQDFTNTYDLQLAIYGW